MNFDFIFKLKLSNFAKMQWISINKTIRIQSFGLDPSLWLESLGLDLRQGVCRVPIFCRVPSTWLIPGTGNSAKNREVPSPSWVFTSLKHYYYYYYYYYYYTVSFTFNVIHWPWIRLTRIYRRWGIIYPRHV